MTGFVFQGHIYYLNIFYLVNFNSSSFFPYFSSNVCNASAVPVLLISCITSSVLFALPCAVLKTSLTDEELIFLNIPVRNRDSDRLSMTTDDLLALPNDGSLPVTRTSALLSRSGGFPLGLSFDSSSRSHSRPITVHKQRPVPAASRKPLPVEDLLLTRLQSHRQAPPPNTPPANRTLPRDTPRCSHLPRWMTSQKSEMDFSGMTSVPELKYPAWLRQCEEPLPPRVPSWVGDLEESSGDARGQRGVRGHAGEPYGSQSIGQCRLRDLRLQKRGPLSKGLPV